MKTTTFSFVLFAIFLSSCTTVYYTKSYEDANYLTQDEFTDFTDYKSAGDVKIENENIVLTDTSEDGTIVNNYYGNYYEADDYYDFSYSARIRRFHRPVWSMGYYGGLYTDYYWYSYNPFHCGMSIYYGYNYYDPFYSPYYSWGYSGYYSPYYSYYNHHAYGHHHYGYNNYYNSDTYSYNNSYDNNSIHYGPRGSLSSRTNSNRSVKSVVNTTSNKNSTYNKFDRMVDKKIITRTIKTNSNEDVKTNINKTVTESSTNRGVKTNTYRSNSNKSSTKGNSYNKGNSKSNRSYTAPKSNSNRNYNNSRGSSTKSSGNSRSSGSSGSNNRSVKPRK